MGLEYIDGQTPLDEDEIEGLRISSISTKSDLDQFEQLNIENAIEWTIHSNFNSDTILTEKFIKELHKRMFDDVWKWAGQFRISNKNIGVDWTQIAVELKTLLDDSIYWIDNATFPHEEVAIRFKHRLVSIHCFPNGNGRHSRLMADVIMESMFDKEAFSWHRSDMSKPGETRKKYIDALKQADRGNINPLILFATT